MGMLACATLKCRPSSPLPDLLVHDPLDVGSKVDVAVGINPGAEGGHGRPVGQDIAKSVQHANLRRSIAYLTTKLGSRVFPRAQSGIPNVCW